MPDEMKKILVVDDESSMRHMLRLVLEREGFIVAEADGGEGALEYLEKQTPDVILCDIRMPGMDGRSFLQKVKEKRVPSTVIMMSAYGTVDTALDCMKVGAYDYISKPFKPDEVLLTLKKAEERQRLRRENRKLRDQVSVRRHREIIGHSMPMKRVLELVDRVADSSSPVLITGETGTGKELVARRLHSSSRRRENAFVAINCSAISPTLIESELFGHAKGAFTGADREHPGLFAAADGGTLFLDEIAELPLELQPKLLRVLQEGEVRRVGETRSRKVDVRVLAATARDLREEIFADRFREDLFYRLAVVDIHIPALRERPEDILVLAEHYLKHLATREGRPLPVVDKDALEVLMQYPWPGNVRELQNFLEKTLIFCRGDRIDISSLPWEVRRREREGSDDLSLKKASERLEQEYIRKALGATGGNRTRAAELLEISLRGLLYKMKAYGIE
jgi:two-component system response regulator AtoC